MDFYLKWNCFDMAEQLSVLEQCERDISEMYERLNAISGRLDPYVSGDPGISRALGGLLAKINAAAGGLRTGNDSLEKIIDIYYDAETKVQRQNETLPAGSAYDERPAGMPVSNVGGFYTPGIRETAGSGIIMEDWLAALVYSQEKAIS
jgi:hypothetical protein